LHKQNSSGNAQRFVSIEKLRSSASTSGLHAFSITSAGVEVFPRLLTPSAPTSYPEVSEQRVSSGVSGLDRMIDRGFWRGSTTLVAGPTGSGKSMLSLQFLHEGAEAGEPGLYVGFQENPAQLARIAKGLGWDLG